MTVGLVALILLVALFRQSPLVETLLFALILTVAAIPVALPAVLSVTMVVGASKLAGMQAIVSRLVSIEEMAGMDILCSDKTGTLTKNELTLGEPVLVGAQDRKELLLTAALTCARDAPTRLTRQSSRNSMERARSRTMRSFVSTRSIRSASARKRRCASET